MTRPTAMYCADTIVARATAAGRAAIAIVRWSGRDALAIAARVFAPRSGGEPEPWKMRLGTVLAADGTTPIDEALAVFFPSPHSFTGEDTFELHSHGSPVVVEQILSSAIAAGARAAERGEFTRRAVLNGKLDLLQAEAIADLVDARMAAGARAAWNQLQGALSAQIETLRSDVIAVLADIEAQADFTDDELPEADFGHRARAIAGVIARIEDLLAGFAAARRHRDGVRVVFTGRPNAGKSSLVNRLLGSGRMIVSDEPGTTRDVVEETVDLGGVAFVLTDTAGIREGVGAAETEAVARALETLEDADIRVLVVDGADRAGVGAHAESHPGYVDADTIVVWNKVDLAPQVPSGFQEWTRERGARMLETSASTGRGCEELAAELVRLARQKLAGQPAAISRLRHRAALEAAVEPLRRAERLAASEAACELAAIELRAALAELSAISSPLGSEEVLDRIFSEFCIGK